MSLTTSGSIQHGDDTSSVAHALILSDTGRWRWPPRGWPIWHLHIEDLDIAWPCQQKMAAEAQTRKALYGSWKGGAGIQPCHEYTATVARSGTMLLHYDWSDLKPHRQRHRNPMSDTVISPPSIPPYWVHWSPETDAKQRGVSSLYGGRDWTSSTSTSRQTLSTFSTVFGSL